VRRDFIANVPILMVLLVVHPKSGDNGLRYFNVSLKPFINHCYMSILIFERT